MPKEDPPALISRLQNFDKKAILINILVAALYFITGKFGLSLAINNPSATAIWPPTGIALAATVLFGFRITPAIFVGAFLLNISTTGDIPTSLGIALGNTLESIVGGYLVNRFCQERKTFETVSNIFKYLIFAGLLSTLTSATIGTFTLFLGGLADPDSLINLWLTWWVGDIGGNLVIAPILLVWGSHRHFKIAPINGLLNLLGSFAGLILACQLVFSGLIPYPYLVIPFGVWISFWFGRRAATLSTLIVGLIATHFTLRNAGPFYSGNSLDHSLIVLQLFLTTFSATVLTFASLVFALRKSEKEVTTNEERFKALIEHSSDGIVLIDPTSKILYASPSVKRVLGYTPEELYEMNGFDLVSESNREMTMKKLAELVLKPGGTITVEYQTIRKDQRKIWVEATGTNLLLEPSVNAVVINFHDITSAKNNQERMRQEKMTDEAMLTSIGEGVIATDNTGRITMINQAACEALGFSRSELLHQNFAEIIKMEDEEGKPIPFSERPITKVLSLGKEVATSETAYYVRQDGTKFAVYFILTPIILEGRTVGTIEVFHDITKEKEVDRAKSEFVSIASHQLRTPLTIINWYLERLMKHGENISQKDREYLLEVFNASHRMVDLINSLLNVSRLELGTFIIEPKMTNIVNLATQVLDELKPQIESRKIKVNTDYPSHPLVISVDPRLMTIVFQNLLSNAIKYNKEEGSINLKISLENAQLTITVTDEGYGISRNEQAKVFTKLFRAENARNIDPDGTGLGLYIVKTIIDASGGRISFNSQENVGTSFKIFFPMSGMNERKGVKELN